MPTVFCETYAKVKGQNYASRQFRALQIKLYTHNRTSGTLAGPLDPRFTRACRSLISKFAPAWKCSRASELSALKFLSRVKIIAVFYNAHAQIAFCRTWRMDDGIEEAEKVEAVLLKAGSKLNLSRRK